MQRAFHLAAVWRIAALGGGIIGAQQFDDIAIGILDHIGAGDEIGPAQADFAADAQAEEFLGCVLHEIGLFNIQRAGEGDRAAAAIRIFRIIDRVQPFGFAFRIIGQGDLQRLQNGHAALGGFV